jgi:hypothetical protein
LSFSLVITHRAHFSLPLTHTHTHTHHVHTHTYVTHRVKLVGFRGHTAIVPCVMCDIKADVVDKSNPSFGQRSFWDRPDVDLRDGEKHRKQLKAVHDATTLAEKKKLEVEAGIHDNPLSDLLPYWDATKQTVAVDLLHQVCSESLTHVRPRLHVHAQRSCSTHTHTQAHTGM